MHDGETPIDSNWFDLKSIRFSTLLRYSGYMYVLLFVAAYRKHIHDGEMQSYYKAFRPGPPSLQPAPVRTTPCFFSFQRIFRFRPENIRGVTSLFFLFRYISFCRFVQYFSVLYV